MDEQKKEQKMQYMEELLTQVVRGINAVQEEAAGAAIEGRDISADRVCDLLDEVLTVDEPDGRRGKLAVDEYGIFVMLGARITGMYEIGPRFNGVVWSEEMDRAPRD
jgi:hypothetical protein